MLKRALFLFLIVLLVLGVGAFAFLHFAPAHNFAGAALNPPPPAPDLKLVDETGKPFSLSDLRGQWILLAYGYTSCPDVCPLTLAHLREVKQELGAQASEVRVVFVTVDPERDTPAVLSNYVLHFGSDFKGLTGTPAEVALAARAFDVKYEKKESDSGSGYLVRHSAFVYLIDPRFRWRVTYPFGVEPNEITADLKYLMTQSLQ